MSAAAILAVQPARATEPIRLNPGYVSLLKLDQTISTIVIGNPDIVDATLQGKNAILLTAKKITGSAATNVIVLNPQDAEIFNATILLIAVVMLTWHNVWMASHGRELAADVKRVGEAVRSGSQSIFALGVVCAVAVMREGSEVALFMYGLVASAGGGFMMD